MRVYIDIACDQGESVFVPAPFDLSVEESDNGALLKWKSAGDSLKIVFLGSSTTAGAHVPEGEGFVDKVNAHFSNLFTNYEGVNLGVRGTNTYHIMPTGNSVVDRPDPDPEHNITKAISLSPDIIVVNMPTNDTAAQYSNTEFVANLAAIKQEANNAGIACFIATTQPRNFADLTRRERLSEAAIMIANEFGEFAIDIYEELTDFDNEFRLKTEYNQGDGIHLSPLGHTYVANMTIEKLSSYTPVSVDGFKIMRGTENIIEIAQTENLYFEDDTIEEDVQYFYAVKAFKGNKESNISNIVAFKIEPEPAILPDKVTGLQATPLVGRVELSWNVSANATSYKIERKVSSTWTVINTISGTTYNDETVNPETEYSYRVTAINSVGEADPSDEAIVTTPPIPEMGSIKVNFGGPHAGSYPTPELDGVDSSWFTIWKNIATEGPDSFILKDENGIDTPYTLHLEDEDGYKWGVINGEAAGSNGAETGDNSGVVPDKVSKHYWFTNLPTNSNGAKLRISGFEIGSTWELKVFSSRTGSNRNSRFIIGSQTINIVSSNNTSEFAIFDSVEADENGEINMIITGDGTNNGYLNALILTPIDEGDTLPKPTITVTATAPNENTIEIN